MALLIENIRVICKTLTCEYQEKTTPSQIFIPCILVPEGRISNNGWSSPYIGNWSILIYYRFLMLTLSPCLASISIKTHMQVLFQLFTD